MVLSARASFYPIYNRVFLKTSLAAYRLRRPPDCEKAREAADAIIYSTGLDVNAPALMQLAVCACKMFCFIDSIKKRDFLDNLPGWGITTKPQGAFYIFPKSPIPDDLAFVNELKQQKVLVVPGTAFSAPGYFRISYCLDDRTLEGSLPGFQQIIQKYRK
jgi:aspartate aminotransferase